MRRCKKPSLNFFSVVLILAMAMGSCAEQNPAIGSRDVPIIIYVVDTLRADRLGLYGHTRPTSPNIDALAAESVVFDQAYAAAPWTLPSVASLITSSYPCEHRLVADLRRLTDSTMTLAQLLRQSGYHTGGFYENLWVSSGTGLARGYTDLAYREYRTNDSELSSDVRGVLETLTNDRFYLYLHTMEPHNPNLVPPIFVQEFGHVSQSTQQIIGQASKSLRKAYLQVPQPELNVSADDILARQNELISVLKSHSDQMDLLYDASVAWADDTVGRVVQVLKDEGVWNKAIFILLSDHGEEIFDHGNWGHGQSIYEELIRVPLLIHFPENEMAGKRINSSVSLVDIMPTVLDYVGLKKFCEDCRGRSLLPFLRGSIWASDDFSTDFVRINEANQYAPWTNDRGNINVGIRRDHLTGIWNHQPATVEIYDTGADPGERKNLRSEYPDFAKEVRRRAHTRLEKCEAWLGKQIEPHEMEADVREGLKALGYLQ
jgi:arylsulfatase A-like enzyme